MKGKYWAHRDARPGEMPLHHAARRWLVPWWWTVVVLHVQTARRDELVVVGVWFVCSPCCSASLQATTALLLDLAWTDTVLYA